MEEDGTRDDQGLALTITVVAVAPFAHGDYPRVARASVGVLEIIRSRGLAYGHLAGVGNWPRRK